MAYLLKEKQAAASKAHYEKNKETYKARAQEFTKKKRQELRGIVNNYLKNHPCTDCGEADIIVLEFDHVRGRKEENIANIINKAWSTDRLRKEIDKCEVRCANCHRRITHTRRLQNKRED